jgi:hypothetical protein
MERLFKEYLKKQVPVSTVLIIIAIMAAGPVTCIGAGIAIYAIDIVYDPQFSALPANNVQNAIDKLDEIVDTQGETIKNFQGPSGPSGATGIIGPSGPIGPGDAPRIIVKDKNGSFVGYGFDLVSPSQVYIPGFEKGAFYFVNTSGECYDNEPNYGGNFPCYKAILYPSVNCTGQPYLERSSNSPSRIYYHRIDIDGYSYIADLTQPAVSLPPPLYYRDSTGCVKWSNTSTITAYPAINAGRFPYSLPLAVPLQIEIQE